MENTGVSFTRLLLYTAPKISDMLQVLYMNSCFLIIQWTASESSKMKKIYKVSWEPMEVQQWGWKKCSHFPAGLLACVVVLKCSRKVLKVNIICIFYFASKLFVSVKYDVVFVAMSLLKCETRGSKVENLTLDESERTQSKSFSSSRLSL